MGEGANRVLAGVVGSFCEGRLSFASGLGAVDRVRHLQEIQTLLPETMVSLGIIITYRTSFITILAFFWQGDAKEKTTSIRVDH